MAGNNYKQFTPREKTILDEFRSKLYALNPTGGRQSALTWIPRAKNIGLEIYTNHPGDDKPMSVNLLPFQAYAVFDAMVRMVNGGPDNGVVFEIKTEFRGKEKLDRPVVMARLTVATDEQGVGYIQLAMKDRPKIKFMLQFDDLSSVANMDGSAMSPAESSKLFVASYVSVLQRYCMYQLNKKFEASAAESANGGGQGGGNRGGNGGYQGGNRGGNGGGGYQGGNGGGQPKPEPEFAGDDYF